MKIDERTYWLPDIDGVVTMTHDGASIELCNTPTDPFESADKHEYLRHRTASALFHENEEIRAGAACAQALIDDHDRLRGLLWRVVGNPEFNRTLDGGTFVSGELLREIVNAVGNPNG